AFLHRAGLQKASLREVTFDNAVLDEALFEGSNLARANLCAESMEDAVFEKARLRGALTSADHPEFVDAASGRRRVYRSEESLAETLADRRLKRLASSRVQLARTLLRVHKLGLFLMYVALAVFLLLGLADLIGAVFDVTVIPVGLLSYFSSLA